MALDEIKIWLTDGTGGASALNAADQMPSEKLLEKTIVNNPDLLMEGLTLVDADAPDPGSRGPYKKKSVGCVN